MQCFSYLSQWVGMIAIWPRHKCFLGSTTIFLGFEPIQTNRSIFNEITGNLRSHVYGFLRRFILAKIIGVGASKFSFGTYMRSRNIYLQKVIKIKDAEISVHSDFHKKEILIFFLIQGKCDGVRTGASKGKTPQIFFTISHAPTRVVSYSRVNQPAGNSFDL